MAKHNFRTVKYYKKVWGAFSSPILNAQNYANYVTDTNITDVYKLFDGNASTYVYLGLSTPVYYVNLKFPNEIDTTNFVLSAQRYNPSWPPSAVKFYAKTNGAWSYLGGFDKGSIEWEGGLNMPYSLDNRIVSKELRIELGGGTLVGGGISYSAYALELSFTGQQITSIIEISEAEYEANKADPNYFKVEQSKLKNMLINTPKYLKKTSTTVFNQIGTPVGSPSIIEGILINPTTSNYLSVPQAKTGTLSNLQVTTRVRHTGSFSNYEGIIVCEDSTPYYSIGVYNSTFICHNGGGYSATGNVAVTNDVWYWLKFVATSSTQSVYVLQDNGYTLDNLPDISQWTLSHNMTSLSYGLNYGSFNKVGTFTTYQAYGWTSWQGDIDLFNTKIIADGVEQNWGKTEYLYQAGTPLDYDVIVPQVHSINTPKYLKKTITETAWTQPILTSNGTLGGNSFAVTDDEHVNTDVSGDAWRLFNPNGGVDGYKNWSWRGTKTPGGITIYNPTPLKVTNILVTNHGWANASLGAGYGITGGEVQGSNDNSNWTTITTFTNSVINLNAQWNISLSDNTNAYKYYRLWITSHSSSAYGGYNYIGQLLLTATQKVETWEECSKAEYDQLPDDQKYIENVNYIAKVA